MHGAGPALAAGGAARVVLVPNTPAVAALVTRLAMAVACPEEPYKRICSPGSITTFACLFGVSDAPPECKARSRTARWAVGSGQRSCTHAAA